MEDFELSNDGKTLIKYHGTDSDVVVPSGVESIGWEAFKMNTSIRSVVLPDGLKRIESCAFEACVALESLSIPPSLEFVGVNSFRLTNHLREVRLPEGMKSLAQAAFCDSFIVSFDVPKNLSIIPKNCFNSCMKLQTITIPGNVETICSYSFYWCVNLKKLEVEEGVKSIEPKAFYKCNMLTEVFLPASLDCLNFIAFENCYSLTSIHVKWTSTPKYANLENAPLERVTLYVPSGTKGIYEQCSQFSKFKDIIEE